MIGFTIENEISCWWKYLLVLIMGSIGGNLFSAIVDADNLGVGSSTSLFGVLACVCTWYYLNFSKLGPMRIQYMIFFLLMLAFSLINGLTMADSGIDSFGHLGGFIYGLGLSVLFLKGADDV